MAQFSLLPLEIRLMIFRIARKNAFGQFVKVMEGKIKHRVIIKDPYFELSYWTTNTGHRSSVTYSISERKIHELYQVRCQHSEFYPCVCITLSWIKDQESPLRRFGYPHRPCSLDVSIIRALENSV